MLIGSHNIPSDLVKGEANQIARVYDLNQNHSSSLLVLVHYLQLVQPLTLFISSSLMVIESTCSGTCKKKLFTRQDEQRVDFILLLLPVTREGAQTRSGCLTPYGQKAGAFLRAGMGDHGTAVFANWPYPTEE